MHCEGFNELPHRNEWECKRSKLYDYGSGSFTDQYYENYKLENIPVPPPIKKKQITPKTIQELHNEDKIRAIERAQRIIEMDKCDLQIKEKDIQPSISSLPNSREGLKMSFANISLC